MDVFAVRTFCRDPERPWRDVLIRDTWREVEPVARKCRNRELWIPVDFGFVGRGIDARLGDEASLEIVQLELLREIVPLLVDAERVFDICAKDLNRRVEADL